MQQFKAKCQYTLSQVDFIRENIDDLTKVTDIGWIPGLMGDEV